MKKIALLKIVKSISFITAVTATNFACAFVFGQEKVPEEVRKLRKF